VTTDLLAQKYALAFNQLDQDQDGLIASDDLVSLGVNLLSGFGDNPASPTGKALVGSLQDLWTALVAHCTPDSLGRLTQAEHYQGMVGAFINTEGGYDSAFAPAANAVVALADPKGTGVLTLAQFTTLQTAFGTAVGQIGPAFQALDPGGTGSVTVANMASAIEQFYTGQEDGLPGNSLFGPLS
jgi:Ca2+-binding EF-hand superfamily protein